MLKVVEELKLTTICLNIYLNHLKICLKHLELRGNDFGSSLEDLFNISFKPSYQKQDPNLEDNWRGRIRSDIKPDAWAERKNDISDRKCLENNTFHEALTGAAALWRRHGGKDIRRNPKEFSDSAVNGIDFTAENNLNSEPDDESEDWNADFNFKSPEILTEANVQDTLETGEVEYWDDDAQSYSKSSPAYSPTKDIDPVEESDWETSSEEQFPNNFQRVYRHPRTKESSHDNMQFTPSDFHVQRISRPEVWCPLEEGQFDDAES
ncbi:hypothetical protein CEXT_427061 [Caerostris extrusa]|uniref:Uncharacterized protein n=1 Tax=Caerostris extrusa TaxID=172846 RepID=A0AAV4W4L3_CAEEX|nr:hypothetical protein CEXT_427061 [Caerostris extrusa]